MPKIDPHTILNIGTDPALKAYTDSLQSVPQLSANTNVYITTINQSVIEYINIRGEAQAAGNTTEVQFNVNDTVVGDAGLTYNFQTDSLTVAGNVSAGSIKTDTILYANGTAWSFPATITTLPGANITGQVSNSLVAGTVYTNAQPNITSVGTLANLTVSGNVSGQTITADTVKIIGSLMGNGASPAPTLSGFIINNTVSANLNSLSHITITGGLDGQVIMTDGAGNLSWTDLPTGGGSSFDTSQQLHLTNTASSSSHTSGALVVDGGVGVAGNINSNGTKHKFNGNLHLTGVDSSSLYIGAYADEQSLTSPVIVAKDSYDTFIQAALINSSQYGSADWVAYSDAGSDAYGWADFGMTGTNFSDINYSITSKNDGYFFVQGIPGLNGNPAQGGNLVLATGGIGGPTHRDIVFATGGFYTDKERMRLDHETRTLFVGAHGDAGGTNVTNLDVNGNVTLRSQVNLGNVGNIEITGGTSGYVLSTDGSGGLSWVVPQSGPAGANGAPGATGATGATGPAGAKGDKGDPGTNGTNGINGVGDTGPKGDKGDTGAQGVSVTLQGTKATISDLPLVGNPGDGWIVTTGNGAEHLDGSLWFWNVTDSAWNDIGPIVGPKGDKGDTGERGLTGDAGTNGTNGADGQGVPTGGTIGQVLVKLDSTDFNTEWTDANPFDQNLNTTNTVTFDQVTASQYNFSDDTVQTTAYIGTGNITFIGDTIGSTNNSINITGSSYTQIECTDNSSYTNQIWVEQAGAFTNVGGSEWSFSTPTVVGSSTNVFKFPNDVLQRSGDYVNCDPGVDTVIYTSTYRYQHTLKLLLNIEGIEDGQTAYDTQSCEMIIAKGHRLDAVAGSAYGLVYTSSNPLVVLSTRWNSIQNRVEVLCRPVSTSNSVSVHSTVTELLSASI